MEETGLFRLSAGKVGLLAGFVKYNFSLPERCPASLLRGYPSSLMTGGGSQGPSRAMLPSVVSKAARETEALRRSGLSIGSARLVASFQWYSCRLMRTAKQLVLRRFDLVLVLVRSSSALGRRYTCRFSRIGALTAEQSAVHPLLCRRGSRNYFWRGRTRASG